MSTVQPAPNGQQDSSLHPADHAAAFKFLDFIFDGIVDAFVEFRYFNSGRRPKAIGRSAYLNLPLEHERVTNEILHLNGQQMITIGFDLLPN